MDESLNKLLQAIDYVLIYRNQYYLENLSRARAEFCKSKEEQDQQCQCSQKWEAEDVL